MVQAEGTGQTCPTPQPGQNGIPAWSADGSSLAFRAVHNGATVFDILRVADGHMLSLPLGGVDPRGDHVWSPEGARLVFQAEAGGDVEIFVIVIETGELVRLSTSPSFDGEPAWSPY